MKKQFLYLFGFLALMACTDDETVFSGGEIAEPTLSLPENKPNDVVMGDVFAKLNLDYPGLEKVKQHYEADEQYYAALALLDYYRSRNVSNPNVDVITTVVSDGEQRIADQALGNGKDGYRFCVAKYTESGTYNTADAVYWSVENSDGTINWSPEEPEGTGREYSYQLHRWQWMEAQAKTYWASRNETYIQSWIEVFNSWLTAFPCPNAALDEWKVDDINYANKNIYQWQGLQTASRVLVMVNILPYYIQSGNFTPELLTTFLNSLAEHVEMVRMNYYKEEGNILITQSQAVASAGILMPEFKNATDWRDEGCTKLNESVDKQWLADGVHCELDPSYHISAISDYLDVIELAEAAKSNGISTPLRSDIVDRLKGAMQFVFDLAYPDYQVDNWNDTRASSYTSAWRNRMRDYAELFPENSEWLYVSWNGSKGGTVPTWTSKTYTTSGWYMLRNWTSDPIMMVLKNNYNPKATWHCQPDNGTFELWYNGRSLFQDSGSYVYAGDAEVMEWRNWFRATAHHNTLTLNNENLQTTESKTLLWQPEGDVQILVTENPGYQNLKHRRSVFFVDGEYFVIVDEAIGPVSGNNNVNLHFQMPRGNVPNSREDMTFYTDFEDGSNFMFRCIGPDNMTMKKEPGWLSTAYNKKVQRMNVSFNVKKNDSPSVRYITVIYPKVKAGKEPALEAKFLNKEFNEKALKLQVKVGKEKKRILEYAL